MNSSAAVRSLQALMSRFMLGGSRGGNITTRISRILERTKDANFVSDAEVMEHLGMKDRANFRRCIKKHEDFIRALDEFGVPRCQRGRRAGFQLRVATLRGGRGGMTATPGTTAAPPLQELKAGEVIETKIDGEDVVLIGTLLTGYTHPLPHWMGNVPAMEADHTPGIQRLPVCCW